MPGVVLGLPAGTGSRRPPRPTRPLVRTMNGVSTPSAVRAASSRRRSSAAPRSRPPPKTTFPLCNSVCTPTNPCRSRQARSSAIPTLLWPAEIHRPEERDMRGHRSRAGVGGAAAGGLVQPVAQRREHRVALGEPSAVTEIEVVVEVGRIHALGVLQDRLQLVEPLGEPRLGRLGGLVLVPQAHDLLAQRWRAAGRSAPAGRPARRPIWRPARPEPAPARRHGSPRRDRGSGTCGATARGPLRAPGRRAASPSGRAARCARPRSRAGRRWSSRSG